MASHWASKDSHSQSVNEQKIEVKLNVTDLIALKEAFSIPGNGFNNLLSLNKEQFIEAFSLILNRGSRQEYDELFDKIDIKAEGKVDWDKISSHMILDYCERDERSNSVSIPQWKDLTTIPSAHKDWIQRITRLNKFRRYLSISKEGLVVMYGLDMIQQKFCKITTDACKQRDLWVVDATVMQNINKIAFLLTSKELLFCHLNLKLELPTPIKLAGLPATPMCMDYWYNRTNHNEALLVWGDTEGEIHVIYWNTAQTTLFERPSNIPAEKDEDTIVVFYDNIMTNSEAATIKRFKIHDDWVRQVRYIPHLDCFISCATTWSNSLCISWLERQSSSLDGTQEESIVRVVTHVSSFAIHQGINAFDYDDELSLIATAGVNYHVNLWNPYVTSKPSGMLRGHMAPVVAVQFQASRQRLISFSKDNVLRIWDTQLQVCISKLSGIYPKGLEDDSSLMRKQICTKAYFHEDKGRLFLTFNEVLTVLEMKPEITDRIFTHPTPIIGAIHNSVYNQIVTACQGGCIAFWLVENGQRVKNMTQCHGESEITCLKQDPTQMRFYTGSTDGTVKVWDMNGHCHHTLISYMNALNDVNQIVILKRAVIVIGSTKHFTVFKMTNFGDHFVYPSEWKGQPEHKDDVTVGCALPPHSLITGSYDGELIIWNTNSDLMSRRMNQRCQRSTELFTDFLYNVSCILLLAARTQIRSGSTAGANIVTCGGNGIVRFWNAYACILIGEFVAHPKVSNIIMAIDGTNELLATADVDGNVKIWNITNYCLTEGSEDCMFAPQLLNQWTPHSDMVSAVCFCKRQDKRQVLATASSDCSVCLWNLDGQRLGIFGQEERWKLDINPRDITSNSGFSIEAPVEEALDGNLEDKSGALDTETPSTNSEENPFLGIVGNDFTFGIKNIIKDGNAITEYDLNRLNDGLAVWENTILGNEYREIRLGKRQRKQPMIIEDMPFLHAEQLGCPNYGPYYSVKINPPVKHPPLELPDFMENPFKYFSNKEDLTGSSALLCHSKLPLVENYVSDQVNQSNESDEPKNKFNEKSLFPSYILEFDQHLQRVNKYVSGNKAVTEMKKQPLKSLKLPDINKSNWACSHPNSTGRKPLANRLIL